MQPHPKRVESSSYGISDFGQNNGVKVDIFTILQEGSEILEGYFVARFIFGILLAIDLNCIVGQMDISISQIFQVVSITACADIPFFVIVSPEMYSVNYLCKGENSDVKFPLGSIIPMWTAY